MPRSGGVYTLPPGYFAVDGTTIEVSQHNPPFEDVAQALTDSLPRDGSAPMTGNLPMGSNKITGLAAGTNASDAVRFDQVTNLTGLTATVTELNYTDGVTSPIQTQLNAKQASDATLTSLSGLSLVAGDILYATAADTLERLPKGTAGRALVMNSGETAPEWASSIALQAAVAAASQTSIDFTGIPAWVNRVTIIGTGLSTNGTSDVVVQLGDSGGFETSGYTGADTAWSNGTSPAVGVLSASFSMGLGASSVAAATRHFTMVLSRQAGKLWVCSANGSLSNALVFYGTAGSKTLSDVLTQVRVTTAGGVNTFDAGSVSVSWE